MLRMPLKLHFKFTFLSWINYLWPALCSFLQQYPHAVSPGRLSPAMDGGPPPHDRGRVYVCPPGQTHWGWGGRPTGRADCSRGGWRRGPCGQEQPPDAPPPSAGGQHRARQDVPATGERTLAEGPQHRCEGELPRAFTGTWVQCCPKHATWDAEGDCWFWSSVWCLF